MGFLSNLFGGIKNLFSGAGNAVSGALKTGGQAIGGVANAGANLGKNLLGQGAQGFNPMSVFGGSKQPSVSQAQVPAFGASPSPKPGAMQAFSSPASVSSGVANTSNPDKPKNWLDQLFPGGSEQGIAGLVAPMLGDMFAPKSPQIPDMSSLSSVQALQNFRPGNSVSPEYQQMIQRNTNQLRDQRIRELQALYHNARPGTDYLTDTNYQRDLALLEQGIQTNMADDLARAEATFSQQEMGRLSEIAQMDVYSIMAQTGLEAQEAQQFKEMFSNVGNMFLTNATRDPNDMSELMSLFGGR